MSLTDLQCKRAKAAESDQKLADGKGLYLFVTTKGFKSWRWKYRIDGREKRLVLGSYPDMSLAEAREGREIAARLLKAGRDPKHAEAEQLAAQAANRALTLQKVAEEWVTLQSAIWTPTHKRDVELSLVADVYPRLGERPITDVTSPQILAMLRTIEARGSIERARRVRQRLSAIFTYAIASGYAQTDPAMPVRGALAPLKKGRQPAFSSLKDARALLTDAEASPSHPSTKLASRFLALTGVRMGVVRFAEWREIEDLDGPEPLWHIPAKKMKLTSERKDSDRFDFLVPLTPQAVDVLRAAATLYGTARLIFPSSRHAHRPMSENAVGYFYNRLQAYRGRHVPHGWRSTFSTVMNEWAERNGNAGDRAIIDLMLAHIPQGVEADYNRAAFLPRRRELANIWASLLLDGFAPADTLIEGPRR